MAPLSDLEAQRATLIRRLTGLRKRVTTGDRTVEYDLGQAEKALGVIDREIAAAKLANGTSRPVRSFVVTPRSGY